MIAPGYQNAGVTRREGLLIRVKQIVLYIVWFGLSDRTRSSYEQARSVEQNQIPWRSVAVAFQDVLHTTVLSKTHELCCS